MIEISLKKHEAFPWLNINESVYIRGYLYDLEGNAIDRNQFLYQLSNIHTQEKLLEILKLIDGCFAIIIVNKKKGFVIAATDRIRSFPLFYCQRDEKTILSDYINPNKNKQKKNRLSYFEFIHTGYVTGQNTLVDNIFQIQAGESVFLGGDICVKKTYYKYLNGPTINDKNILKNNLQEALDKVFLKLIKSINGRTLIVPLSGGLDSRLIVANLHKHGIKNIICYTYGLPDSKEVRISKSISADLGYDWYFINYADYKWKEWYESKSMKDYLIYSGNLCSLPHIQDWPAVLELKRRGLLPKNSIFIPGHAADFVAGSHLPPKIKSIINPNVKNVSQLIVDEHFMLSKKIQSSINIDFKDKIYKNLAEQLSFFKIENIDDIASSFEYWDWLERQSKFIANSCRVYEYWGYEWRMPFWDKDFMDFWKTVPLNLRLQKSFYKEFLVSNDYESIFNNYNYKNYEKKNLRFYIKKSPFGRILTKIHKRFYAYYKLRYIDIIGSKNLFFRYFSAYNINSILALKYLEAIEDEK